jgi:hypothetical protein
MKIALLIIVNLIVFVGLPAWLFAWPGQTHTAKPRSNSSAALGNAIQELDRLLARPSIEYRVAAEDQDKLAEDDKGGE